ncbi:hypothetical protein E2C01_091295 [Portunus trituberculatus]|uniref:Uncharacterized protein n=1 Tax=Portunus trituberculatus TaxID=210409 RepID=A0A5B7JSK3_PORTR|nr:hypothetical protein [Portunus trituberculatus]
MQHKAPLGTLLTGSHVVQCDPRVARYLGVVGTPAPSQISPLNIPLATTGLSSRLPPSPSYPLLLHLLLLLLLLIG